ncbi:hypothetical protein AAHE18_10G218600 [Arachis hypogaea]
MHIHSDLQNSECEKKKGWSYEHYKGLCIFIQICRTKQDKAHIYSDNFFLKKKKKKKDRVKERIKWKKSVTETCSCVIKTYKRDVGGGSIILVRKMEKKRENKKPLII